MQNSFSSTITRNNFRAQPNDVRFAQNNCDWKTLEVLRNALVSELDAINDYENFTNQTSNENAKRVLREIRDEERVHAGELLALMQMLCPDEQNFFNLGREEVMKLLGNNAMSYGK